MTGSPRTLFAQLRAKARTGILLEGAGVLALAGFAFFAISYGLDRMLRLEVGYRATLLVLIAVLLLRIVWKRWLVPLGVALHDEELALAVERNDAMSKESLITAVQFEEALAQNAPIVESRELMQQLVRDVHQKLGGYAFKKALDGGRVARYVLLLVACLAAGGAWAVFDRSNVKLWLRRNVMMQAIEWPRRTLLSFADAAGELRLPEGDDLTLRVRAQGVVPEQVFARFRFANGEKGSEPMTGVGEGLFTVTLQAVLQDVRVVADGGDGLTPELRVSLVQRPRISDLAMQVVYPPYTGKEPSPLANSEGDVKLLRGSKLVLSAKSSKPLARAFLGYGVDKQKELAVDPQKLSFSGDLTPEETGLITVEVLDSDRLGAARAPRLFVRLVDDQTPRLEYKALGIGPMITPQARIPGSLAVRDDFGLTRLAASMRIAGGESAASQPTSSTSETMFEPVTFLGLEGFRPGAVEFANLVLLDLLPMNSDPDPASAKNRMHPDQTLSLRFTAGDNFGPGAPHEGESEVVTFRLVTRDRLIDELQRRQEEQRKELTQIIEQQKLELSDLKSIVSPTSADPRAKQAVARLAAMARAQRSLGKRTQQVAQRYKQILDEMANNRLLEETQVRVLESQIVQPLQPIAADDFPTSAHLTEEFSTGGKDDVRSSAVAAYESILFKLEQVLKHMHELENLAAITRDLRELIQQESDLSNEAQRRLRETFNSLPGAGSQPTTKKR